MTDTDLLALTGRTAIVTGGGSGIGQAIAHRLARAGARVAILDVADATPTVDAIRAAGGEAMTLACDVTRQRAVDDAFAQLLDQWGALDVLVNSAGISHIGTAASTSEEDFDRVYAVNVKGVYNCLRAGVRAMLGRGGAILNIASVASTIGIADRFAYSMSKGAVLTMTLSVARDYIAEKIRCNCVSPGRVHTPFVDGFLARTYPGREAEMFAQLAQHAADRANGAPRGDRRAGGLPLFRRRRLHHREQLPDRWRLRHAQDVMA